MVWWEAWAAAAGIAGFLATTFLGIMTLFVAKAANSVSGFAAGLAKDEATARVERENLDGLLVLARVQTEVAQVGGAVKILVDGLEVLVPKFPGGEVTKKDALILHDWEMSLALLKLPVANSLQDKFVYLPKSTAGQISRALGLCDTIHKEWEGAPGRNDAGELAAIWEALPSRLLVLRADLDGVRSACTSAIGELDISPPELIAKFTEAMQKNG